MNTLRWTPEMLAAHTARLGRAVESAPQAVGSASRRAAEAEKSRRSGARLDAAGVAKPLKYHNTPTTDAGGVKHASKKQAVRYRDLGLLLKSGEAMMLAREVRFRLPGGIEYRADHVYANQRALEVMAGLVASGDLVVEDVKSAATQKDPVYRLKRTQMRECLGIEIKEVM